MKTILIMMALSSLAHADLDLKPEYRHDVQTDMIETRESTVNIGGVEYRRIEYEGRAVYLYANQPESIVDCSRVNLPTGANAPSAVEAGIKINKRTRAYLEGLSQYCNENRIETSKNPKDFKIGVKVGGKPDPQNPNANEKDIYVQPLKKTVGAGLTF